jgi:ribonuclease D
LIAAVSWPVDKSQQMGDWTARPLSQRQMHYAALDAFVLPQLYDRLCSELGEQRSQQLLKQHTTSVRRVSAADGEQQQQQQDTPQKRPAEVAGNADPRGDAAAAAATAGDGICNPSKRQVLAAAQDTESK